jgi:hypothetical protein
MTRHGGGPARRGLRRSRPAERLITEPMDMLYVDGMPPEEIRAILEASDPEIVRRYLELHRERLRERLDDRLRALDLLEAFLTTRDYSR